MLSFADPISFIHGLTPHERRVAKNLSIETVSDLLNIFPRRYDDYSRTVAVARIPDGEPVTIRVRVKELKRAPTFRTSFVIIKGILTDETGDIAVTWFNQPWLLKTLLPSTEIFVSGVVTRRPRFGRGLTNPLWEYANAETLAAGTVAPVYPLQGSVTQKTMRSLLRSALRDVALPEDVLPTDLQERFHLLKLAEAYRQIHHPTDLAHAEAARRRFALEELLRYELAMRMTRAESDASGAPALQFDAAFAKTFASHLSFALTDDQKKAVWVTVQDLQKTRPMRRLLQGDVGSGKTAVAAMLSALVFRSAASTAVMAPTDVLAKQHAATFRRFLEPYQIPVLLLTSSTRKLWEGGEEVSLSADSARERLRAGRLVAIGTQALLFGSSLPSDTMLSIVDEQHRFGVLQREAMTTLHRQDDRVPHFLSMTATPIPRSLMLVLMGDVDVSLIQQKPLGRAAIATSVIIGEPAWEQVLDEIYREAKNGHRVYVVVPNIEKSEDRGRASVEEVSRKLVQQDLKGLRIRVLHGRLASKEKEEALRSFVEGETDVLVSTTVVEVGVDVPEATVMVILSAERFGLAQLHQLRGRVGRSDRPSFCFLVPSEDASATSLTRLKILERTSDGFAIAEADLGFRGEGDVFGAEQSGSPMFRVARLTDIDLFEHARVMATELLTHDPMLEQYPQLAERVVELRQTSHVE